MMVQWHLLWLMDHDATLPLVSAVKDFSHCKIQLLAVLALATVPAAQPWLAPKRLIC